MTQGAAAAVLNIRKPLDLSDGRRLMVRRLKTREVKELVEQVGADLVRAMGGRSAVVTTWAEIAPQLIGQFGETSFQMFSKICSWPEQDDGHLSPEEVGDLDVEDYAALCALFAEMHEAAIANFRRAGAKFEERRKPAVAASVSEGGNGANRSSEPSTDS
jgi:hypothetical protein